MSDIDDELLRRIGSLSIEQRSLDSLRPYAANARKHSEAQIDQIIASIREFGWTNPLLLDEDGGLIAGHGRLEAASRLGLTRVPTLTIAGLTEAQRRALVIADNKIALNAVWDTDLLASELKTLQDLNFDMDAVGFSVGEMSELLVGWEHGLHKIAEVEPNSNPTTGKVVIECRVLDAEGVANGIKAWVAESGFDDITVRLS
jgi:ParB-like chromosome segregation protein Spo0J